MVRISLLILAGGFAAEHSRVLLDSDQRTLLFVASILIFLLRRLRSVSFFILGFALFMQAANTLVEARLDPKFAGDSMITQVRVADFPRVTGTTVSMLIEAIDDRRIPPRTRVSWYDAPQPPEIGETWELEVRLRRPRGTSNPGLFSHEDWLFREKLQATGYVVNSHRNRRLAQSSLGRVDNYRRDFVRRAETAGVAQPVLAAVSVGARHLLTREHWDRYAKTGTSHLMAISGLHVGLAAAFAYAFFVVLSGTCRLRGNHLDQATLAGLAMAATYTALSGFAVPSQRALIMLVLAGIAMLTRRRPAAARILAFTVLVIFVADPVASMTPGFRLSFAAVALLLAFACTYAQPCSGPVFLRRPVSVVRQLVRMQLTLLFGLAPLTILSFQRLALLAPAANLLTVPIFSLFTVPLALASMVVAPLWNAAAAVLAQLAAASVVMVERIIALLAAVPYADTSVAGVNGLDSRIMCVIFLPALWVLLPRGWPGRWIAVLAVPVLLLHQPATPPYGCVDAHVLDVGQGQAIVVQSRRHTLVFDTGQSYRDGGSAAEQFVLPFLRYRGIASIDWLVASHADDDHAGGVPAIVHEMAVGQILAGEALEDPGRAVFYCVAGQAWDADGVRFEILHPPPGAGLTGNNASCVLTVSAGHHAMLLTGDIELAAEARLLADERLSAASVVLIPHHGSLTSSSPPFVNRVQPALAIASVGYANRWGFPKERVTSRWEGVGARVLDTARSGAISFRLCAGDGVSRLRQERLRRQRIWHDTPEH